MKPGSRGLLEAIKWLTEFVDMTREVGMDKALRLFHEHLFGEHSMQEGIGDIELFEWPVEVESKSQDEPNGGRFDDGTKGLIVVNTITLLKALSNKAGFVPIDCPISVLFQYVHPLVLDNIVVKGSRAKGPSVVVSKLEIQIP